MLFSRGAANGINKPPTARQTVHHNAPTMLFPPPPTMLTPTPTPTSSHGTQRLAAES
ncbi:hypothetical protein PAXINDRAFT_17298 [Paxillus involutus ATCC 200175]|uniref:Uncharacterized protein n=1 Tax=Paxillus involutus ATCC 200175 TaxID=664439 RepID=A0A0C9TPE0_PAXIN|nr:hypothetical protein PAXINDRAFT_17298 [Paxillus involutus ATCC 200175]